jgi:2-polyprenyl-6-methoxyphenol hydroxylase-like FAD-dependent oxidoreductase
VRRVRSSSIGRSSNRLLLDSLLHSIVRWGHKVTGVRALDQGRYEARLADGTTVVTSLLVGADGAWSRVRPLLSDATPQYVGVSVVETFLFDGDTRHPAAAEAVGAGSLFALAPGKGILAHRESGGTLHTYTQLLKPPDWLADIDAAAVTARVVEEFGGWAPELTALITESDTPPVLRRLFTLPIGHRWDRVPGVTLLGDAAHLMPPNGEGANLAMHTAPNSAGPSPRTPTTPRPPSPNSSRPCSRARPPTPRTTTSTRSCSVMTHPTAWSRC